jgi:hypothetical protein
MPFNGTEGSQITLKQGAAMTANFRNKFPNDTKGHFFGKDILNIILSQSACMGIRFYQGINNYGELSLVIVGVDSNENDLLNFIGDVSTPCPNNCDKLNSPLLK